MFDSASSTATRVLIIGGGIAGPVLAMFLKRKGYDPIVFERHEEMQDAGLSLMLQSNGLRVLALLPSLYASLPGQPITHSMASTLLTTPPSLLGSSAFPSLLAEKYDGYGMRGVPRSSFHALILSAAQADGIPIRFGHGFVAFEQGVDWVEARFANGVSERGSFLIGCDGLHSAVREQMFGNEEAAYTGKCQIGGFAPTSFHFSTPTFANLYADNAHMITYPVSPTTQIWAITLPEAEHRESWRTLDRATQDAIRDRYRRWGLWGGELVANSTRIVKYGLYDRPELETWHQGRVVLLGDAAHPTTPHLGQGANQALEDIYHLTRLLPSPSTSPILSSALLAVFTEYENLRIGRCARLVKEARKVAEEMRVVEGGDEGLRRDERVGRQFADEELERGMLGVFEEEPFRVGESEL